MGPVLSFLRSLFRCVPDFALFFLFIPDIASRFLSVIVNLRTPEAREAPVYHQSPRRGWRGAAGLAKSPAPLLSTTPSPSPRSQARSDDIYHPARSGDAQVMDERCLRGAARAGGFINARSLSSLSAPGLSLLSGPFWASVLILESRASAGLLLLPSCKQRT